LKSKRRTPYEGVPKSFGKKEMSQTDAWYWIVDNGLWIVQKKSQVC
jgi:hypothetical protein